MRTNIRNKNFKCYLIKQGSDKRFYYRSTFDSIVNACISTKSNATVYKLNENGKEIRRAIIRNGKIKFITEIKTGHNFSGIMISDYI